jgi:SAM-dependent methyltransferase
MSPKSLLSRGRGLLKTIPYRGLGRWCPVCERSSRRFRPYGNPPRAEAQCIHCGSLERHRFVWLLLNNDTDLFDGRAKNVLHFAPERCLEPLLRLRLGAGYRTADLEREDVDLRLDMTDIRFPDETFDVIICSHVLEHVPDDRRAMQELHRVLASDGWALVVVPVTKGETFEDPTIVDPDEKLRVFGQRDHVRRYGLDIADRLQNAGFAVAIHRVSDAHAVSDISRMGLRPASRPVFTVTK